MIQLPVAPKITPFDFGENALGVGEAASVQCVTSVGDLPLSFSWLLDGQEIKPFDSRISDLTIGAMGKRSHFLNIESVRAEHAGNYTCRVENSAGTLEHTASLVVNG